MRFSLLLFVYPNWGMSAVHLFVDVPARYRARRGEVRWRKPDSRHSIARLPTAVPYEVHLLFPRSLIAHSHHQPIPFHNDPSQRLTSCRCMYLGQFQGATGKTGGKARQILISLPTPCKYTHNVHTYIVYMSQHRTLTRALNGTTSNPW